MSDLEEKNYPEDLEEDFCIPEFAMEFSRRYEVPMCEEFNEITGMRADYDEYNAAVDQAGLYHDPDQEIFKLLGYADLCQGSMISSCEAVFIKTYEDSAEYTLSKACDWVLLFQVDIISNSEFELMIGDAGRIYFYIRKDDLKNKKFENCWFMTQCY